MIEKLRWARQRVRSLFPFSLFTHRLEDLANAKMRCRSPQRLSQRPFVPSGCTVRSCTTQNLFLTVLSAAAVWAEPALSDRARDGFGIACIVIHGLSVVSSLLCIPGDWYFVKLYLFRNFVFPPFLPSRKRRGISRKTHTKKITCAPEQAVL